MENHSILYTIRRMTAAVLAAAFVLGAAGCGQREQAAASAAAGGSSSLAAPESAAESSSAPDAALDAVSAAGEDVNSPEAGECADVVIPIETYSPEFDKLFAENPIDASYVKEMADAVSTLDMVAVCRKYAELWEAEIDGGMEKLLSLATDDREVYRKEQEDWETGRDANLAAIDEQAGAGGSLSQLNAASERMDFFRTRANQILRELYSYDPSFTYVYEDGGASGEVSAAG